jgi:hypothetical protein
MEIRSHFNSLWNRFDDFEFAEPQPNQCRFALKFAEWAEEYCRIGEDASIVSVNQAKVMLLDKYFEWYNVVPRSHRRRIGSSGHVCIYQVFMGCYERLKLAELTLMPPLLLLPSKPPPPPQIAGIFLGDIDD